jgi:hypothetical protein
MESHLNDKSYSLRFCSSLRVRPVWSWLETYMHSAKRVNVEGLYATYANAIWITELLLCIESSLQSYDVLFAYYNYSAASPPPQLRILILEPSSLGGGEREKTVSRITHLFEQATSLSRYCAIALMLPESTGTSSRGRFQIDSVLEIQDM